MYNPNEPQRMYLDPSFTGPTYPFTYTAITDPLQVPQGPRPEGNVAYQPTSFVANLSSTLSPSNSTTEYSNTQQQLGASIITYKPGDSPGVGASVPASAAAPYINLMQPPPAPPSPVFDAQRMTAAGQAPSFALFPGAQAVFSQPNTPLQATQTPQVYQAPYLIQSRQQPQTFTAAAAPTTGTPPATPQHLVFFPSAAQAASVTSFYSLTPAAAAPTAVVGGGGGASHLASSAAGSAMAYQQPTPPAHSGGGTVAYVVDAAQLLSVTMPPSYVRVASSPWSAATPLYNAASAATLAPRDSPSLAGADAAAAPSTSQQRPFSAARTTAARHATSLRGDARPPPINALVHRSTGGALAAGASTTAAAAGGSPEGIQPAALGVRNFSAPEPVGSCLLPNLPLDPIIPPLALPCPRWGKLPHSSGGEKDRVTR